MYVFFEPSESWHTRTCVIFVALPLFKSTNTATTTISPTLAPSSSTVARTRLPINLNASTTHQDKTTETTTKTTTTTKTPTTITTTTTTTTTTPTTTTTTTSSPVAPSYGKSARTFDGWSFFGGILFAVGLSFLGFVGFKYYKTRITVRQNYNNF